MSKLKNFSKKELNERIAGFKIEELSSVSLNNLDVVARLRAEYECVGCLANMSMLTKDIFAESMYNDIDKLNSLMFFKNLKINEFFEFTKIEKANKSKDVILLIQMNRNFIKRLKDDKEKGKDNAINSFTTFLVESISLWDYLRFKSHDNKKSKAKARCELHSNKDIIFSKWEYSWRKLPME